LIEESFLINRIVLHMAKNERLLDVQCGEVKDRKAFYNQYEGEIKWKQL